MGGWYSNQLVDYWMNGWMDKHTCCWWVDGWMDGWMDGGLVDGGWVGGATTTQVLPAASLVPRSPHLLCKWRWPWWVPGRGYQRSSHHVHWLRTHRRDLAASLITQYLLPRYPALNVDQVHPVSQYILTEWRLYMYISAWAFCILCKYVTYPVSSTQTDW